MFSGIVEKAAVVRAIDTTPRGMNIRIKIGEGSSPGESIAIDGVCLTVAAVDGRDATFNVIPETLSKTTLGRLQVGSVVNIERSLKAGERIDGHFVQGHVDGVGHVTDKKDTTEFLLWIAVPTQLQPYIVPRSSVAVNGVSLTIARVNPEAFMVALIPVTLERTNLGRLQVGDAVNIETDMIARHIVHYLEGIKKNR